jgi:hypothetical protein
MFKISRFLTVVILLFIVLGVWNCGGGGGGGGGSQETDSLSTQDQLEAPTFDATAGGEDGFLSVIGSSNFTPPSKPVMISNAVTVKEGSNLFKINDVPWSSQLPPGTEWKNTANCGPASYLMAEAFHRNLSLTKENTKEYLQRMIEWLDVNDGEFDYKYNPPWKKGIDYYYGAIPSIYHLENMAKKRGFEAKAFTSESMEA